MTEKCGVRLTVHNPEDGHERPGRLSLLFVRTIGLFVGGTLLLEGFPSSILGVVVLLTGVIVIPLSSFYGVMAFTRG